MWSSDGSNLRLFGTIPYKGGPAMDQIYAGSPHADRAKDGAAA